MIKLSRSVLALAALTLATPSPAQNTTGSSDKTKPKPPAAASTSTSKPTAKPTATPTSKPDQADDHQKVQAARKAFAAAVGKAHRPNGGKALSGFKSLMEIWRKGNQENVAIDLDVLYGDRVPMKSKTSSKDEGVTKPMIRYKVSEGGKPIQRGHDGKSAWMSVGKVSYSLRGRDYVKGRNAVKSHLRLSRQVLRLLSPGTLLAELKSNSGIVDRRLPYGRRDKRDYKYISGRHDNFPTFHQGDGRVVSGSAFLEAWVEPKTHRLVAIRVHRLGDDGRPTPRGEYVSLRDFKSLSGLLLAQRLDSYPLMKNEMGKVWTAIWLRTFELNPKVSRSDFKRPY